MQKLYMGLMCFMPSLLIFVDAVWPICGDEDDCGEGYTCLGGICRECLMCSLILRKGGSCVTDFRECGDCLEGTAKPCKPIKRNVKFKECTSSNNCPPNKYCTEDSCVECFDCAVVNRLPPVDGCAKGLFECGSCINGFSEAAVTTDTNYTRCHRAVFTKKLPTVNTLFVVYIMAFGCFLLLLGLLLKKISKSRSKHKISSLLEMLPSAPPLHDIEMQSKCTISPVLTPTYSHFEIEQRQGALVFKQPDAFYYPMKLEMEDEESPRGNNSNTHPASCSDSAQEQPSHLPVATFTPVLDRSQEHDSTDSGGPPANGINNEGNDSISGDSVTPELS